MDSSELLRYNLSNGSDQLYNNTLVFGFQNSGVSSFVNSLATAIQPPRYTTIVRSLSRQNPPNASTKFRTTQQFNKNVLSTYLPLLKTNVWESWGINSMGEGNNYDGLELDLLMKGMLPERFPMPKDAKAVTQVLQTSKKPNPYNTIHSVAFVIPQGTVMNLQGNDLLKIRDVLKQCKERGRIPFLILSKVDEVLEGNEDLDMVALDDIPVVTELRKLTAGMLGIPVETIHGVINYNSVKFEKLSKRSQTLDRQALMIFRELLDKAKEFQDSDPSTQSLIRTHNPNAVFPAKAALQSASRTGSQMSLENPNPKFDPEKPKATVAPTSTTNEEDEEDAFQDGSLSADDDAADGQKPFGLAIDNILNQVQQETKLDIRVEESPKVTKEVAAAVKPDTVQSPKSNAPRRTEAFSSEITAGEEKTLPSFKSDAPKRTEMLVSDHEKSRSGQQVSKTEPVLEVHATVGQKFEPKDQAVLPVPAMDISRKQLDSSDSLSAKKETRKESILTSDAQADQKSPSDRANDCSFFASKLRAEETPSAPMAQPSQPAKKEAIETLLYTNKAATNHFNANLEDVKTEISRATSTPDIAAFDEKRIHNLQQRVQTLEANFVQLSSESSDTKTALKTNAMAQELRADISIIVEEVDNVKKDLIQLSRDLPAKVQKSILDRMSKDLEELKATMASASTAVATPSVSVSNAKDDARVTEMQQDMEGLATDLTAVEKRMAEMQTNIEDVVQRLRELEGQLEAQVVQLIAKFEQLDIRASNPRPAGNDTAGVKENMVHDMLSNLEEKMSRALDRESDQLRTDLGSARKEVEQLTERLKNLENPLNGSAEKPSGEPKTDVISELFSLNDVLRDELRELNNRLEKLQQKADETLKKADIADERALKAEKLAQGCRCVVM